MIFSTDRGMGGTDAFSQAKGVSGLGRGGLRREIGTGAGRTGQAAGCDAAQAEGSGQAER